MSANARWVPHQIELEPTFTILDGEDSADLMNLVQHGRCDLLGMDQGSGSDNIGHEPLLVEREVGPRGAPGRSRYGRVGQRLGLGIQIVGAEEPHEVATPVSDHHAGLLGRTGVPRAVLTPRLRGHRLPPVVAAAGEEPHGFAVPARSVGSRHA
jgi:hypothetical protein